MECCITTVEKNKPVAFIFCAICALLLFCLFITSFACPIREYKLHVGEVQYILTVLAGSIREADHSNATTYLEIGTEHRFPGYIWASSKRISYSLVRV